MVSKRILKESRTSVIEGFVQPLAEDLEKFKPCYAQCPGGKADEKVNGMKPGKAEEVAEERHMSAEPEKSKRSENDTP